jgi:hypothetical protein
MLTIPMTTSGRSAKYRKGRLYLVGLILLTFLEISAAPLQASDPRPPFGPGEKLTFRLKWTIFNAGEAVLEVLPNETIDGQKARHFVLHAKSNAFIDAFYKVRERIDAYTDLDLNRSLLYKKKQIEGKANRDVVVTFDWHNFKAQYSIFGDKQPPITIAPGTFDPLSVFYYARLLDWEVNREIRCPITDGKKFVIGQAKILKRETIKVAGQTYDTFLIEPDLQHIGGVFEKSKDASISLWVTADHRRIPVKIKSKVVVGSFVGELISATGSPP